MVRKCLHNNASNFPAAAKHQRDKRFDCAADAVWHVIAQLTDVGALGLTFVCTEHLERTLPYALQVHPMSLLCGDTGSKWNYDENQCYILSE